jgi:cyclopropane-fatty-acyl-phospholipid synthase
MDGDGASRAAIEYHYDVSREFYRLWLDARMVYSCAFWPGPLDDDLEAAQVAKLDWHADAAAVPPGGRVLDVGSGWGAMLAHLADHRGARATGLTLSTDQAEFSASLLSGRAEVRLEDWRSHEPTGDYDAIVSVGAFEHFARPELDQQARRDVYGHFFTRAAGWLGRGGRLSLQTIAYEDAVPSTGPVATFFTTSVFPESSLPFLSDIVVAAEPHFRVLALRSDPGHYSHTLELWQRRLESVQAQAVEMVGRDTYRHYLRYLRLSRASFDRGDCTLYRLVLERRGRRRPAGS